MDTAPDSLGLRRLPLHLVVVPDPARGRTPDHAVPRNTHPRRANRHGRAGGPDAALPHPHRARNLTLNASRPATPFAARVAQTIDLRYVVDSSAGGAWPASLQTGLDPSPRGRV